MISVAVIGTGYIGQLHSEALRRIGGVRARDGSPTPTSNLAR
jgi:hypothetical protein